MELDEVIKPYYFISVKEVKGKFIGKVELADKNTDPNYYTNLALNNVFESELQATKNMEYITQKISFLIGRNRFNKEFSDSIKGYI